jgi:hypothetical protein
LQSKKINGEKGEYFMANNEQRYNFTLAFNADTRSAKREMTSLVEEINKLTKNTLSRQISFGNVKEEA